MNYLRKFGPSLLFLLFNINDISTPPCSVIHPLKGISHSSFGKASVDTHAWGIIANAGILISKVIYIKNIKNKKFVILDAAMNDFMRSALYGSKHKIIPSKKNRQVLNKRFEFVGPICESTDKFLTVKKFQNIKEKDLIIICDVGAYGMSLASNYNTRPLPAEILIKNSNTQIIRHRQKLADLI